jgi:hypothetical protein
MCAVVWTLLYKKWLGNLQRLAVGGRDLVVGSDWAVATHSCTVRAFLFGPPGPWPDARRHSRNQMLHLPNG